MIKDIGGGEHLASANVENGNIIATGDQTHEILVINVCR
jgi:hypothetical protein